MNNIQGYKTRHLNHILEKERIHVYEYMIRRIIKNIHIKENDMFKYNFLCNLLDSFNDEFKTKYTLNNFPELVQLKEDAYVWWRHSYELPKNIILEVFPEVNFERITPHTQTRLWVLLEAIDMLKK